MGYYVYHYCAHYQPTTGQVCFQDGIAVLENPINDYNSYIELKKKIDLGNWEHLTISSLSFLRRED